MLWKYKGIEARIWPLDHCPPHVTFISRAGGWVARIKFSMFSSQIEMWDIKPMQKAPSWSLINELANQVDINLEHCRNSWWSYHNDVCLDNKVVERVNVGEVRVGATIPPLGKVVAKSGIFQPAANAQPSAVLVNVEWLNGSITTENMVE